MVVYSDNSTKTKASADFNPSISDWQYVSKAFTLDDGNANTNKTPVQIKIGMNYSKQANIAYWQNYEAEHECDVCGNKFIAHYPLTKYCSKSCARKAYKVRDNRHRYKNITVDKGITLPKLAKRDRNQCKICGLFVDWNDFVETDKTKICGDMYPSIDHITPISLRGLHSWDNVQLAHRGCNTKKNNRFIG